MADVTQDDADRRSPEVPRGGARVRRRAPPAAARRVRRAGPGQGAARAADRRRPRARRARRPPAVLRAARARQDHARRDRRQRDRRRVPADVRSRARPRRATSPRSSPTSRRATSCSSTRSTGCRGRSRRSCIRRSRTSSSTWCSARARARAASGSTCRGSRWSARRPVPGGSRCRCASGSGSRRGSTTTRSTTSAAIVRRSAGILGVSIDADGAHEIARRSRGTPRVANRLLRRVRDFAEVRHDGAVTAGVGAGRPRAVRGRRAGPGQARPRDPVHGRRRSSAAGRSGCRRWPRRSGRRPTRSRTWSSPTCCSSGSSSGRRGAGWPPSAPTATSGSRPEGVLPLT